MTLTGDGPGSRVLTYYRWMDHGSGFLQWTFDGALVEGGVSPILPAITLPSTHLLRGLLGRCIESPAKAEVDGDRG